MKQLQNNFTTPEQSKRLLELGLPADSADCYISYNEDKDEYPNDFRMGIRQNEVETDPHFVEHELPCWSVGRLIEIYFICSFQSEILIDYTTEDLVDYLVSLFESVAMDFSKLEE